MRDLWIRLYVHALLRGSYIFTDLQFPEPPAESPTFDPSGFIDVWRGKYHGNPVCIKFIRTRNKANLRKMKKVHGSLFRPESNSPSILPDLSSRRSRVQEFFPPKYTSRRSSFAGFVPVLYHESMDARRKHYAVHEEESECQSANAGMCPSRMVRTPTDRVHNSSRKSATASPIFMG
jgi:hypothetical protein